MKTKTRLTKQHWVLIALGAIIVIVVEGIVIFFILAWNWAVIVFAVAFVYIYQVSNQQEKQRIEAHFAGRPALGENEFGKHYFRQTGLKLLSGSEKFLPSMSAWIFPG